MKSILKTLLVTALAGGLFGALLRKFISEQPRVPTVNPEETLEELDLHVAQNSPL